MIPTGRLVVLLLVPLALAGVAVAVPAAIGPMVAVDLLLLLVAVVDGFANTGAVEVDREVGAVQAVGRPFPVTLTIRSRTRRALRLRVTDDLPGVLEGLPATLTLPPGSTRTLTYRGIVPERGSRPFGPITVRWRSRLGLFERQVRVAAEGALRVVPTFRQLRTWGLMARVDERRAPARVRRRAGGENEFERLRPYVRGDSYRHVDWRATARQDQLVTREFGQERGQNVIFLLDAGRMMSAHVGEMTAFDHALDAAVTMGQVALRHGDRVGLLAYDDGVRAWLPPKGGARAGARLIRGTYDLFPSLREPDHALALRWLAQRVRQRSLVVLLTTVVDGVNADAVQAITGAMIGRHLPLCVWLRDPSVESLLDPVSGTGEARASAGAAAQILLERERWLDGLRARGVLVLDVDPASLTPRLLARYLEVKAQRRL